MVARAAAAGRRREGIVDAVIALAAERFLEDITLADVADRAGVTVQTVLRHFEGRDALLSAAVRRVEEEAVQAPRRQVVPGDIDAVAFRVVADYERFGDTLMRWLAQEERVSLMRPIVERGRSMHHAWIEWVFEPQLSGGRPGARKRLRAQLIAVTDVYTWKLLRRDLRLSRREAERAIAELIRGVVANRVDKEEER